MENGAKFKPDARVRTIRFILFDLLNYFIVGINCLKPKLSVNANIVAGTSFYFKDKIIIRCKNGDVIQIECRADSKWNPEPGELC